MAGLVSGRQAPAQPGTEVRGRECALGVEAVERFVAGETTWRVHQAVFGVLAMESEPVDPRL
ncbi:hypothetical protein DZG00_00950 [Clavibacter lycopersici]|uniref:Polynucleotide kinase-phosphatase ligase domain-containing protein n=1 Tax=Clavibacter lycopersici TaxID=2301718 RepID=A0A399TGE3_9MICO|nr:hypothetical protein [Clavibacter lycopersici]RIJ53411.1 hypothetical protein DZG00_00950 [Clavibacter lycopersici]RIJ62684.1 hypothetical protein DZG02_00540 [Clavibacter lycopersici]